ncbi:MAG: hypothetical protein WD273_08415 [Trueperaceae bacterium]
MVTIELLYFDGCPSWQHAWTELGLALNETRTDATVRLRNIEALPESERRGFAGSPTLRIAGRDLEGYDGPAVMACRRYEGNAGRGWPPQPQLQQRLRASGSEEPA